jgi:hypothetical protein
MTYARQAEFARQIGYDKSRITQLKNAGRLVMSPDGKRVDVEASIARIADTSDPGRMDVTERHAAKRAGAGKAAQQSAPTAGQPDDTPENTPEGTPDADFDLDQTSRAKAKAELMHYENGLLKIETMLRRGLRFERAAVKREATSLGAMVRAGIERIIDHTAPRLAATRDDYDRRIILEKEVARLRWMIKREMPRVLRRMKDANNNVLKDKQ